VVALYLHVLGAYWPFVLVAAVAERGAFRMPLTGAASGAARVTETVAMGGGMMEPYKNVMRMHALIFFFAFAHFARLENFLVYAVVYAVYFFPWRLVRRGQAAVPWSRSGPAHLRVLISIEPMSRVSLGSTSRTVIRCSFCVGRPKSVSRRTCTVTGPRAVWRRSPK
jgi:hypothetical protein